ncbi:MAG: YggS family pyridoxal phosphate-dependent enzyme [Saprospiraceae bacterium]|nr:YggS family pyridoxal phosphate-dependent enzyme [Candidatus Brachybacter algidus]
MDDILSNLKFIKHRIKLACNKSGRDMSSVQLLLATKTVSAEKIKIALNCGEKLIGENKSQELKDKFEELKLIPHQTHFIGHLQSNKIKEVLKYSQCIQSIDRIDLVQKLDQRLQKEGRTLDIMIQVNTSFEESKFGINPANVLEFAEEVAAFDTLKVTGLMTIGLFSAEESKVRKCFKLLNCLKSDLEVLQLPNFDLKELSMGMSNDLEIAIEEGATIIRFGTAIFGSRIYPDSYYWNEKQ